MRPHSLRAFGLCAGILILINALPGGTRAADRPEPPREPAASCWSYAAPDGGTYFALGLRAEGLKPGGAFDHILLVDTSASQKGIYRTQSLQAAEAFIAALPATDRVCLMAVDMQVEPLTQGFFGTRSREVQAGLRTLRKRVPLGATNLEQGLQAARKTFSGERRRTVTYIGDGMSTAQLIQTPALRDLLAALRKEHTPVHSFAVGANVDLLLLGILAQQTGGLMRVQGGERAAATDRAAAPVSAADIGRDLARAAVGPVFYPDAWTLKPAVTPLLPETLPPLRTDRQTIVLSRGQLAGPLTISASGQAAGKPRTLRWNVTPAAAENENQFLSTLWAQAERDRGLSVPLAGRPVLELFREFHNRWAVEKPSVRKVALAQAAEPAPADAAEEVVAPAPEAIPAPSVPEVEELPAPASVVPAPAAPVPSAPVPVVPVPVAPAPAAPVEILTGPGEQLVPPRPGLLEEVSREQIVRNQMLAQQVNQLVERVRNPLPGELDAALDDIKRMITIVNSTADIDPAVRDQLLTRLEAQRLQVAGFFETRNLARAESEKRLGHIEASRRMLDELQRDDDKLKNLVERARALMIAGNQGTSDAFAEAEALSRAALELRPISVAATSALFNSQFAGQLENEVRRQRSLKNDKFIETLYQVELSHVPFPDEPPILWPNPERWLTISRSRLARFRSADMKRISRKEELIRSRMDASTNVEFIDTPLRDALDFLSEFHKIDIVLNEAAMTEQGVLPDAPVNLTLRDVSLRSALRLMLEPLQLVPLVQDDVLRITTRLDAASRLSTRVYPVGDLVISVNSYRLNGGIPGALAGGGGAFGLPIGGYGFGGFGFGFGFGF